MGKLVGGVIGGIGAKKAAKQQRRDIVSAAQGLQTEAQSAADILQPFANPGANATSALANAFGLGGDVPAGEGLERFRETLGFKDMLNRSLRGVAASGAARGLLGSSGTGERFQRTAGELASGTYNDYLQRLFGLQQAAQQAAANRAQILYGAASDRARLLAGRPTSKGRILSGMSEGLEETINDIGKNFFDKKPSGGGA